MATSAQVQTPLTFGTGHDIYTSTLLPAIESATEEVLLITCFWASSPTLDALNTSLLKLNKTALQCGNDGSPKKIRVRIGFSSCSLIQKLFHTASPEGRTYRPEEWSKKLGLPRPEELTGLDLEVKSIFFLPFSVWHPKFVVIDRKRGFLPSCNVSWEEWFEGCVEMEGKVVREFVEFWRTEWAGRDDSGQQEQVVSDSGQVALQHHGSKGANGLPCKFLPSPHHRNPRFRLPWQQNAPPPRTPLNLEILHLLANAKRQIHMQSPNVTCQPVLSALVEALERGVDLTIITSEKLMILEQLVTAGTTTARCVRWLVKKHRAMLARPVDEEAGLVRPGRLQIAFYSPRIRPGRDTAEPVQSHLKLTVVDESIAVFGSGNMDRASWYTSQELGVAFYSAEFAQKVSSQLGTEMKGRTKLVYTSTET